MRRSSLLLALVACAQAGCPGSVTPRPGDGAPSETGLVFSDASRDGARRDGPPAEHRIVDGPAPDTTLLGLIATSGWQIYSGGGYRYGPSLVHDPASGTLHMWSSSPGANGAWDYIRYSSSKDGGHTWSPEVIALQPTPGSRDAFSVCDPGAVLIKGYWYVGYTSTEDSRGTNNQVYLARSTSPSGPFDKWNGTGWGGAPQPVATYSGDPQYYGAGEPSLILVGTKLYLYYSYNDAVGHTDLATVDDATVDGWPAKLVPRGHVITHRGSEDSTDLKYVDAKGLFLGVATFDRFGPNATIVVYQSKDGLSFEPAPYVGARAQAGAHNAGLCGNPSGHIDASTPGLIGYAYQPAGSAWGNWPTYLDNVQVASMARGTPVAGAVSSIVGSSSGAGQWGWSGPRLWDGNPATVFSSDGHGGVAAATEWAVIDLGKSYPVTGVTLTPRGAGLGFPTAFSIQTSADASAWTDVPGQSYSGYANPGDKPVTLTFAASVTARYVRLLATTLGPDDNGNHYLQLGELSASIAAP